MTATQNALIDWENVEEIIAHRYSVMDILGMHPKLYAEVFSSTRESTTPSDVITAFKRDYRSDARALLKDWISRNLFLLRDKRWCRKCCTEGHTFLTCTNDTKKRISATEIVLPDIRQAVERNAAIAEASTQAVSPEAKPIEPHHSKKRPPKKAKPSVKRQRRFLKDFNYDSFLYEVERDRDGLCKMRLDAFHMGEIKFVEPEGVNRGGFISSSEMQRSLWFSIAGNQIGFGLKRIQPGEKVWFRLKQNDEKHFCAVQVSPVDPSLDEIDIGRFLRWCESTADACMLMGLILASQKQWVHIIQFIRSKRESRKCISQILKFIAYVSALASSSIIDKTDSAWLKNVVVAQKSKETAVFVPSFLRSNNMVRSYAAFFLASILRFGQHVENAALPDDLTINTHPDSIFEIIREMIFQDMKAQRCGVKELSDAGAAFFPSQSRNDKTPPFALGSGETVLILKILLGCCVLLRPNAHTKDLMSYMLQIVGKTLSARKDQKEVSIFIPLLQAIHVTHSCMDKLVTDSFHALRGGSESPCQAIQSRSNDITLRAEELNYALDDPRSPFHMQNIADLNVKQKNIFDHFHAHYVTIRSEFYLQLARVIRSCVIGDKWCAQVQETFAPGDTEDGEAESTASPKEAKEIPSGDAIRDVRLVGIYVDHNYGLCPMLACRFGGMRVNHETFTSGALLTFVTGLNRDPSADSIDAKNAAPSLCFDRSELFSLSVIDSVRSSDQVVMTVRAVGDGFPWKSFLEKIRRNEYVAARADESSEKLYRTLLFPQQSFFPAFEPVLNRLHDFLRLPFRDLPFPYLFGENQTRKAALIPDGYHRAFEHIITRLQGRYRLDSGQSQVMESLKSESVLLVQGPPGTGKSFVGTRIVEAFTDFRIQLKSRMLANLYEVGDTLEDGTPRIGPVLILTFKNHALDEFLKDIISTGLWCDGARAHSACACTGDHRGCCPKCCRHEKRVVRIGTRICDQSLLQHTLGEIMSGVEKQQGYIDALKRFCIIKDRMCAIFRSLREMKSGGIPAGLFLKYLTPGQRESFVSGTNEISSSVDGKSSCTDLFGQDIIVNTGTSLDFHRWLQGEANKATLDPLLNGNFTKENIEQCIESTGDGFRSEIQAKLFQKDIVTLKSENPDRGDAIEPKATRSTEPETNDIDIESRWSAFLDGNPSDANHTESFLDSNFALDITGFAFDFHQILSETYRAPNAAEVTSPGITAICPWVLSTEERHEFIASIIEFEVRTRSAELAALSAEYRNLRAFTKRIRQEDEISVLQRADVIAATSTGCTMHIELIKHIAPSVLIVEEAAEMLEAHLLSCLTPSMKQLILIGDHQQLRPRIDNYDLIADHHINVSLFERLARENYQLILLNNQRRMQKEIADLIRPFYVKENYALADHESVREAQFVSTSGSIFSTPPGFPAKVCFWDHDFPEQKLAHGHSLVNEAEIAMTLYLVNFSLLQGVKPTSITVITPYAAQRREIINALRKHKAFSSQQVAVTTVDRFQGDENDVIILSLVRTRNLTDFLQLENRMIVSCSRARHQFIILGSKKLLQKCAHWRTVLRILGEKNIYKSLPLFCTRHPQRTHRVTASNVDEELKQANLRGERMRLPACLEKCVVSECHRERCPRHCHLPFAKS